MSDHYFMRHALALAERGLGQVAPNPSVGCVIVSPAGHIVGRGWTQPGGRPHAEAIALAQAGELAKDATAYVTLEPCCHDGRGPPCAQSLIAAGVKRVVVALEDPDSRVAGKGLSRMRDHGIEVITGVLNEAARDINCGYLLRQSHNRPHVTLKIARSLDGRIAFPAGGPRWITGEKARQFGHLLRARSDAILVGSGTVITDDPDLTCRLPGLENRHPVRVVLDRRLRTPPSAKVVSSARAAPTIIYTRQETSSPFRAAGVEIVRLENSTETMDLQAMLADLAKRGITRLLVEGGAAIYSSFIAADLVDMIELFTAPVIIGEGGLCAFENLGPADILASARLQPIDDRMLGDDHLASFARKV